MMMLTSTRLNIKLLESRPKWNSVKEETIRNCFKKAGFEKDKDEVFFKLLFKPLEIDNDTGMEELIHEW
jgi:hypothetical protein